MNEMEIIGVLIIITGMIVMAFNGKRAGLTLSIIGIIVFVVANTTKLKSLS